MQLSKDDLRSHHQTVVDVGLALVPQSSADGPPFVSLVFMVAADDPLAPCVPIRLRLSYDMALELHTAISIGAALPWKGAFG